MNWRSQAACAGTVTHPDEDIWFPSDGTLPDDPQLRGALGCCLGCPVIVDCFRGAIGLGPIPGVWGGTTFLQRQDIRAGRVALQDVWAKNGRRVDRWHATEGAA